jgi:hypothetical protein
MNVEMALAGNCRSSNPQERLMKEAGGAWHRPIN